MKKKLLMVLFAVILVMSGIVVYFEMHYSQHVIKPADLSGEQVLAEMPLLAFTEGDQLLADTLASVPAIRDAVVPEGGMGLEDEETERIMTGWSLSDCLPEGASDVSISFFGDFVSFSYIPDEYTRVLLSFDRDGMLHEKTIGIYGEDLGGRWKTRAVYSNQNGEYTKYVSKRVWFSHFRSRMWEE